MEAAAARERFGSSPVFSSEGVDQGGQPALNTGNTRYSAIVRLDHPPLMEGEPGRRPGAFRKRCGEATRWDSSSPPSSAFAPPQYGRDETPRTAHALVGPVERRPFFGRRTREARGLGANQNVGSAPCRSSRPSSAVPESSKGRTAAFEAACTGSSPVSGSRSSIHANVAQHGRGSTFRPCPVVVRIHSLVLLSLSFRADVAQLAEAAPSKRAPCRFESGRRYQVYALVVELEYTQV